MYESYFKIVKQYKKNYDKITTYLVNNYKINFDLSNIIDIDHDIELMQGQSGEIEKEYNT